MSLRGGGKLLKINALCCSSGVGILPVSGEMKPFSVCLNGTYEAKVHTTMEMEQKKWFVMRSLFNTELQTKERLDRAGIRSFIPMEWRIKTVRGRNRRVWMPVVSNLIFVHSDQQSLRPYLAADSKFQFTYRRGGRQNEPMVVPDDQMEAFMKALEEAQRPIFLAPQEIDLSAGTRIRVVGGALDGMEGYFMKLKGLRAKRLVVMVPDALAVAVEVDPEWVEVLPSQESMGKH